MADEPKPDTANARAPGSRRTLILRWVLRLIGPVILAVVLLRLPQPSKLWDLVKSVHGLPLAAALLLNVAPLYLKGLRWTLQLRTRGIDYPTRRSVVSLGASLYLGMLTPGRVGDVVRVQYLRHEANVPYAEGLASIVLDRLMDLYVLAGFVSIAVAHYGTKLDERLRVVSWVMVGATLVLPVVLFIPGLAERVLRVVYRRMSKEASDSGWPRFLEGVRSAARGALLPCLLLTVAAFAVGYVQGYLAARAMGLELSLYECTCLIAVQSFMGLLPISVSGVGVREAFYAAVFPAIGFSAEQGTAFGLLVFFVVYVALVGVGAVAWQVRPPPTGPVGGASLAAPPDTD
ncbi:MAG: lysylphosphatidylglycerol synthase transmembrane domain-containing protein [Polyangiaceae bacterium]